MPQIGPLEILVVMVVALLVFGPEKLPEMARNLGRTASQLKRMAQDMKDDFSTALDDDEEDRPAPGSGSTRPRAAGALPGDGDSAADVAEEKDGPSTIQRAVESTEDGSSDDHTEEDDNSSSNRASAGGNSDAEAQGDEDSSIQVAAGGGSNAEVEDEERSSIDEDIQRLNRQQQDAEAAAETPTEDSKIERSE
ncbi:MAG: twin-arginine translocase TatA/TatE family subunit [Actinobacteria bacterium]|nr:twin-arginine translocase TatA/TatE family subunit [Actinomycetota bacterium]